MPKKTLHFTQARIKTLPVPDSGRVEYYDDEEKRLMCRVSSTGNKTYSVVKWADGKIQRVTLSKTTDMTVTEARQKAMVIVSEINSGINPTEVKRKKAKAMTPLEEVLEAYIVLHDKLKPYTVKNYRYKLKLGFSDWLKKPVNTITEDMVKKRHGLITKNKGETTANTTMRVLRLTLNHAVIDKMIGENPTRVLSDARLWHKNNRKDRVIPSAQLKAWHEAVEALANQKAKVYFLLALYMGFRSTELLTLEWSHVDMQALTIKLHDTKNGSNHQLPIPMAIMPYVTVLQASTGGSGWVFAGKDPAKHIDQPRHQMKAVIEASGVEFSPHDCRRTFATIAEAVGLPMTMIKRLMNHVTTNDVTGGYIVTEEETLREAINKVANYIQARVTQKDNVIQLHATK
jgi:integrase